MTFRAIAHKASVSISTVARVVNGHPAIDPETAERVRGAMRDLKYVPKPAAERRGPKGDGLVGMRTRTIALLLIGLDPGMLQDFPATGPLAQALNAQRMRLTIVATADPAVLPAAIDPRRIDGVIIHGLQPTGEAEAKLRGMPVVWMMTRRSVHWWSDWVEPDNVGYGALAAQHLCGLGHTRIALLDAQPDYPVFVARRHGFTAAAEATGATVIDLSRGLGRGDPIFRPRADEALVSAQVDVLLALEPRPTALFVLNGGVAVHRRLRRRGIQPMQDLHLLCGEMSAEVMGALDPSPARIDISVRDIAFRVVEQILWRLAHRSAPGPVGAFMPAILESAPAPIP